MALWAGHRQSMCEGRARKKRHCLPLRTKLHEHKQRKILYCFVRLVHYMAVRGQTCCPPMHVPGLCSENSPLRVFTNDLSIKFTFSHSLYAVSRRMVRSWDPAGWRPHSDILRFTVEKYRIEARMHTSWYRLRSMTPLLNEMKANAG